ncbi:hypothetical protein SVAN01_00532 [Stagonosporopsis vannaccii]|nr:hypothetical protein SVAN01_00532 [Stagonosporopsis vannaccii]
MSGAAKKTTPAQWVGGQRRKLVRRNRSNAGPPRSSTLPVLTPSSAAASLSKDSFDQYSLQDHVEAQGLDGKMQKHGLFHSKKPRALDHQTASSQQLLSPLPASTPTKAARFFGIEPKPTITSESPLRVTFDDSAIADNLQVEAPVRPLLKKQESLPLLTRLKLGTNKQSRSQEEDVEPKNTKQSGEGASKVAATKGLRMLLPEFAGPRRSPVEQHTNSTTQFELSEDDSNDASNSFRSLQVSRSHIPAAPSSEPAEPKRHRHMRRKAPKDFQRMSPITETSIESLRPANRESEEVTELGVISEYEHDDHAYNDEYFKDSRSHHIAAVLHRAHNEIASPRNGPFKLDDTDLSPSDELYHEWATDEELDYAVHPGLKVDMKLARKKRGDYFHLRSPLQDIENAYLDATEGDMRFEARRMTLARVEAEKQAIDAEVALLKRDHEQMKLDFDAAVAGAHKQVEPDSDQDEDENEDDLVSLCSSIELDEEPTAHEAKVMTFTRITPGMVKLVDIPPRGKNPISNVNSSTTLLNKTASLQPKKTLAAASSTENIPVSPLATHDHHSDPDCTEKPKKSKLKRDESRLLVQTWVSDYNRTEQRPISTRIDPDVLADQETPPAPFPKSDESLPTPPFNPRSESQKALEPPQKHYCIENGHIFHPVNLKTIPDGALVNTLEVRPYLRTYTGTKQHVKIPVFCEKCAKDCDENLWKCEIAVCRMVVCQACAEKMEVEWQQRAISGWKYK